MAEGTGTAYASAVRDAERWAVAVADLDQLAAEHALDPHTLEVGRAMVRHADRHGLVPYGAVLTITRETSSTRQAVGECLAALYRIGWWTGRADGLLVLALSTDHTAPATEPPNPRADRATEADPLTGSSHETVPGREEVTP